MRLTTRVVVVGATVLALVCCSIAFAASNGDASSSRGTTTGKLEGVGERAASCSKAQDKLASAKKKLKALKQNDASSRAIKKAKQKLKKAKDAVGEACGEKVEVYNITAISASFDVSVTGSDNCGEFTKDAHWTSSLAREPEPAELQVYRDNQGRPVYYFFPGANWAVEMRGSGVATRTCNQPAPGPSGTSSCSFENAGVEEFSAVSNEDASTAESMALDWFFGFTGFAYDTLEGNGPTCTTTGPRPPTVSGLRSSPSLFVSSINEASDGDPLSPVGTSTVPPSTFGEDATLNFSGSYSGPCLGSSAACPNSGASLEAQWQMTVTLRRR